MRFIVRRGESPIARADRTLLAAMGLPSGGVLKVGETHVQVRPGDVSDANGLELDDASIRNAKVSPGAAVEAKRALLSGTATVVLQGDTLPATTAGLVAALQGRPVTTGDDLVLDPAHLPEIEESIDVHVVAVSPRGAALVGSATRFVAEPDFDPDDADDPEVAGRHPPRQHPPPPAPSMRGRGDVVPAPAQPRRAASSPPPERVAASTEPEVETSPRSHPLLAGLENELDMLTGWFTLLTSPRDLPNSWGLPQVAGVILDGPPGVGKRQLVAAAADAAGARLKHVEVDQVYKPEKLLDLLSAAVKTAPTPAVIHVDRLEAVAGQEGLESLRQHVGAILRWFLDAVAERPATACVLDISSSSHLDEGLRRSALLPRTLSIPPPDLDRRRILFRHALERVPMEDVDVEALAARSAGFSGTDIVAVVVHASAMVAANGGKVTGEALMTALRDTPPSLGSVPAGEIPSFGFERVAGLAEVKQRLTEAVIWPMTDPERFARMGIDPPRGILLYGPPGTGKTFVVKALAHEAGAAFFAVKGAELLDKYVGESERGVRDVFARARAAAPSIIFFDEIDALAPVRGSSTTSVTDSVVAAMLTELDGMSGRGDVVVIGATNRPDLVDPALQRSGRFEVHIELGLPDVAGRRALLDITDVPFGDDVDLDDLAEKSTGLSFADLAGLLREAALAALRRDEAAATVTWEDLGPALDRFQSRLG